MSRKSLEQPQKSSWTARINKKKEHPHIFFPAFTGSRPYRSMGKADKSMAF